MKFIKILLNYITGYVNIFVEGYFIERFINICTSKNIYLWNIKREKSTILYANLSISDFRKLKYIAKKTGCIFKIKSKKGLPFIFDRYKKRKIFGLFLLVVFGGILFSSQFVWNIEVTGTEKINPNEIIQQLEDDGLKVGQYKKKIDINQVINDVRLKRSDIAWLGIDIKGTNAIVEIVEATPKPVLVDYNDYCNIVADKEGIITKISAQNGTPLVKPGDIVRKGDILIGGWMASKYTPQEHVHSIGDIEARVWYTVKDTQNMVQTEKVETGSTETKYSIDFNKFKINLYKVVTNFKNYDRIVETEKVKLFSNFYLPIELVKTTNKEYTEQEKVYTKNELKDKMVKELEGKLKVEITPQEGTEVNILNEQVNEKQENSSLEVEVIYEVLEKIGIEQKI
ncbi:MAG: sporulation protein YqfD [Oscillospiraceae bacterium]|nr:sporulation protein YqfD [Oscillospiraceae bacterium]